jgi:hypothetical protein
MKLLIPIMRLAGHVASRGEKRYDYRVLVGKPGGMRPIGRPKHRWENSIIMDLRVILWDGVDWIHLAQDIGQWRTLVNTVMKFWEILR